MKLVRNVFYIIAISTAVSFTLIEKEYPYSFQDPSLSIEVRVNDLISRLTLEEKVAQMLNTAPAIDRLGIPSYNWWNEVLHGVARTPYPVTVYPQAIGMAATFDTASLKQMADFSALEGRAVFNRAVLDGKEGERYHGLTYWTPNINIFRDPRWGRGQETYGEDPYLTSMLGRAFVHGLQGDDPKYLKAAACAKHYAVHSGPEPLRHVFDVKPGKYDLWDTYLPAFEELVVNAKVAGVMCAYNAIYGEPCCGSDILMNDILRNQWKFTGYVTSDCWAIDDFFKNHKTHPDAASASADAVMHGTDLDCGTDAYKSLVQAVKDGKISERQIDVSVKRLFTIRFKLGLFDPVEMVKYAQTPASVLESEPHKAHALKMARQSIVLLKNEKNTLPLKKNMKKIAVIGPNADNAIAVLGNYNGTPSEVTTALEGIKQKVGNNTEVVFERATTFTKDTLLVYTDISGQLSIEGQPGVRAEYFDNKELKGSPVETRIVKEINHRWQEGESVVGNLKATNFSVRYTTDFKASNTGIITFEVEGDDGYRFFIDGEEKLEAWERNRWGAKSFRLNTEKGKTYKLTLEYFQDQRDASIQLRAGNYAKTDFKALANKVKSADAIIFVGGISPQLEGEEMEVDEPGFEGGDRTSIVLPKIQTEAMKALKATGKPVVFVMMTGSAVALPWESENIPAIINAWYAGQSAGTAIADILFGDYNPAGRLPVTFYKGDKDLPPFDDYSMENRTYRYFNGEPLYGFGYGLSYTTFKYDQLNLPVENNVHDSLNISVRVTNSGKMDGDEVVQLYLTHQNPDYKAPLRALKGFQRIHLKAGVSRVVTFTLRPQDKALVGEDGTTKYVPGKLVVHLGGSQPTQQTKKAEKTVEGSVNLAL